MAQYLQQIPSLLRLDVAQLADAIIDRASAFGDDRWGVTPFTDGVRLNVGWTEILTTYPEQIRLIVDGKSAHELTLPQSVELVEGEDARGYYPSAPGSILALIQYDPAATFRRAIKALLPSVMKSVDLAVRRKAGQGVKAGHRQAVVTEFAGLLGRELPAPSSVTDAAMVGDVGATLMQGAQHRVVSSQHERNPAARAACIAHYGATCLVCGFSFETAYGPAGAGFIHVHHPVPVSARGGSYTVDPLRDLVPVCPNCHAMLHKREPPFSIQELQDLITRKRDG